MRVLQLPHDPHPPRPPPKRILVSIAAFPRFCMLLSNHYLTDTNGRIQVDVNLIETTKNSDAQTMWMWLSYCRPCSTEEVKVCDWVLQEFMRSKRALGVKQLLNRAKIFRPIAVNRQYLYKARSVLHDVIDHVSWWLMNPSRISNLIEHMHLFWEMRDVGLEMLFASSKKCNELGSPGYALDMLERKFEILLQSKADKDRFRLEFQYHYGLAPVAQGEANSALWASIVALQAKPGLPSYVAAIENMRKRLSADEGENTGGIASCNMPHADDFLDEERAHHSQGIMMMPTSYAATHEEWESFRKGIQIPDRLRCMRAPDSMEMV